MKKFRKIGILEGYSGLISGKIKNISSPTDVSNIITQSGTVLYSDRCPEFKTPEGRKKAIETCRKFEIDGVIACGGDGTFMGATKLSAEGIPTVGVPGTIDADITSTDYTIGFDTAMNTVIDMVDKMQRCRSNGKRRGTYRYKNRYRRRRFRSCDPRNSF